MACGILVLLLDDMELDTTEYAIRLRMNWPSEDRSTYR